MNTNPFHSPFKLYIPNQGYVVMSEKDYEQASIGPADKATTFTSHQTLDGYFLEFNSKSLGIHSFDDLPLLPKPVCTLPEHQSLVKIKQKCPGGGFVLAIDGITSEIEAVYQDVNVQ
ncbi:hypothetical protein PHISCL_09902 [Aspergillus sclerotialis]|uniref:Uncharacterized protein n=1 Tax=Aspergillus sclerotialis TaxID=2070753 RepID=A0A3A2ZEK8_9EURO|nr:hypothetical protein PHISCL_09902 [Aspergillus sclerotialis]